MAEKVQSDVLGKWLAQAGRGTVSISSDTVLDDLTEFVNVDTTGGSVKITLPDTSVTNVEVTRKVIISDSGGNAGTNVIEIVPNPLDSTSIENISTVFIEEDFGLIIFEYSNVNNWSILANANRESRAIGAFSMAGNATVTVINTVNVYEDIAGTATGAAVNSKFSFSTSPNKLTYDGSTDITILGLVNIGARRDSGAAVRLSRYTAFKDEGAGFVELPVATTTIDLTNQIRNATLAILTTLTNGDVIKVQVRNEDDTADILVVALSMILFEVNG